MNENITSDVSTAQSPDSQQKKVFDYVRHLAHTTKATEVIGDLRTIDFKSEVLPIDEHSFALIKKDFVFWAVTLLAVVPLILVTLNDTQSQLTGFCLFFAAIWGLVFKRFVVEETSGWTLPIAALFFTGIVGINLLLFLYKFLPDSYLKLSESDNATGRLIGSVFQTGIFEELCKVIPVIAYLLWKRRDAQPMTIVLIGVFSGLGFSAFENLQYANRAVIRSANLTGDFGPEGLQEGVKGAMVNVMLRSMSSVFGHAVYSGIFAYFIASGFLTGKRRVALFLVGLLVAASVHGLYNWFWTVQTTLPAIVTAVGFMLFYAYLTKLRLLIASASVTTEATLNEALAAERAS